MLNLISSLVTKLTRTTAGPKPMQRRRTSLALEALEERSMLSTTPVAVNDYEPNNTAAQAQMLPSASSHRITGRILSGSASSPMDVDHYVLTAKAGDSLRAGFSQAQVFADDSDLRVTLSHRGGGQLASGSFAVALKYTFTQAGEYVLTVQNVANEAMPDYAYHYIVDATLTAPTGGGTGGTTGHGPGITFATYNDGIWAYNHTSNAWTRISTAIPNAMDEGADGTLFASFPSGTSRFDFGTNTWTTLSNARAGKLSAANDNTLFATFGNGTYECDSTGWHRLTTTVARQLAAVGDNRCYATFGNGTFKYVSGWTRISTAQAAVMDATDTGTLFASFGTGTFAFTGTWTRLTTSVAKDIAAVSSGRMYATFASGTFRYDGAWSRLTTAAASYLSADASTPFVANFGNGTFEYESAWNRISATKANLM